MITANRKPTQTFANRVLADIEAGLSAAKTTTRQEFVSRLHKDCCYVVAVFEKGRKVGFL